MKVLVIDIGGAHAKILATGQKQSEISIGSQNDPQKDGRRG
jgi:hypothetical protein